jgi:Uncharacterized protein conserved in bacteria
MARRARAVKLSRGALRVRAQFQEAKHKRDSSGKFADKPGAGNDAPRGPGRRAGGGAQPAPNPPKKSGVGLDDTIKIHVKVNPKKAGSASAARFAHYKEGLTVREYLKAGGTREDMAWDMKRGFVSFHAKGDAGQVKPPVVPLKPLTPSKTPPAKPRIVSHDEMSHVSMADGKVRNTGGASEVHMDRVQKAYDLTPPKIKEALKGKVVLHAGETTSKTDMAVFKLGTPPGYPKGSTWNTSGGYHSGMTGRNSYIVINEKIEDFWGNNQLKLVDRTKVDHTVHHEVGHAISRHAGHGGLRRSDGHDWRAAYEADVKAMLPKDKEGIDYFLQAGDRGPEEAFAEIYAAQVHTATQFVNGKPVTGPHDPHGLKQKFPRAYKIMDGILGTMR